MAIFRRSFLAMAASAVASVQRPTSSARHGLLFNCDGSAIHIWGRTLFGNQATPLTRQQFVGLVFGPIEETPVDTLLFSFGSGNVAEYQSDVLEWPGQADDFEFPKSRTWHGGLETDPADQYRNPHNLARAGHNPPGVIVEECHKRGMRAFVSLRMNDTHDGQHPRGALPNPELPSFKRQNVEWLLEDLDRWSALDYRRPQVRALRLRTIEEFFDRWDFDGIELDWLRHTLNFPRGTEAENAPYLTDFMTTVRSSLQKRALQRGRPIELAVRVPERLSWCEEAGFDVGQWMEKDLIDLLILGQGLTELPSLDDFRQRTGKRRLPIFASLYSYGNGYRLRPDEAIRGDAANLYRDGADGLYLCKWTCYGAWRRQALRDIADPRTLKLQDKHYTVVQRFDTGGRNIGTDYLRFNTTFRDAPVPFDLEEPGDLKTVRIPIASVPRQAELWIGVQHEDEADELVVSFNGTSVGATAGLEPLGFHMDLPPGNGMLGLSPAQSLDMHFRGLRYRIPIGDIRAGRNTVSIRLAKRRPQLHRRLRITRIELAAAAGAAQASIFSITRPPRSVSRFMRPA